MDSESGIGYGVLAVIALIGWLFYPFFVGPFVMKMPPDELLKSFSESKCLGLLRPTKTDFEDYLQSVKVDFCEWFARRNFIADEISQK